MTAASDVIAWKYANAFVPDAEMSTGARSLFLFGSVSSVDWLRQRMGGLWVGGAVTLTRDALYFGPNALNAAAHADDTSQYLPLDRVAEVRDRFGWLTSRQTTARCSPSAASAPAPSPTRSATPSPPAAPGVEVSRLRRRHP